MLFCTFYCQFEVPGSTGHKCILGQYCFDKCILGQFHFQIFICHSSPLPSFSPFVSDLRTGDTEARPEINSNQMDDSTKISVAKAALESHYLSLEFLSTFPTLVAIPGLDLGNQGQVLDVSFIHNCL